MGALWISKTKNLSKFVCYQQQYSMVVRDIEDEIVPVCLLKELGVVCWSPLAGGSLAGKYKPGAPTVPGSRSGGLWLSEPLLCAHQDEILATLLEVAADLGRTPAQTALRWTLDQPFLTSAIVGARSAAQIGDSLGTGAGGSMLRLWSG